MNTCLTGGRPFRPADVVSVPVVDVGDVAGAADTATSFCAAAALLPARRHRHRRHRHRRHHRRPIARPPPSAPPAWRPGDPCRRRSAERSRASRRWSRRRASRRSRRTRASPSPRRRRRGVRASRTRMPALSGRHQRTSRRAAFREAGPVRAPARESPRRVLRSPAATDRGGRHIARSSAGRGPGAASHSAHRSMLPRFASRMVRGAHRRCASVVSVIRSVVNILRPSVTPELSGESGELGHRLGHNCGSAAPDTGSEPWAREHPRMTSTETNRWRPI